MKILPIKHTMTFLETILKSFMKKNFPQSVLMILFPEKDTGSLDNEWDDITDKWADDYDSTWDDDTEDGWDDDIESSNSKKKKSRRRPNVVSPVKKDSTNRSKSRIQHHPDDLQNCLSCYTGCDHLYTGNTFL